MQQSGEAVWDTEKGELRIRGQRRVAVDVQALCDHIDSLVGLSVAGVIIGNHESRLGKEDVARFRKERPQATVDEIIEAIIETDLLSGTGITKVTLPEGQGEPILVEITNPSPKGTGGAGKAFLTSYWAGALSVLMGSEYDAKDAYYNEAQNRLTARIVKR